MSNFIISAQKSLGDTYFDIDLKLPNRGITAIFGRSGAGKTTLINMIAGLVKPEQGHIAINDKVLFDHQTQIHLPIHKRRVGYVFQDSRLFPHYTVQGNLKYGAQAFSTAELEEVCQLLDIKHLLKRYPRELSGGEKQRVAIGRALLSQPDLLLMDEPLASLDLPRKREVMPYLEQLAEKVDIPILYVTHSLSEIVRLAQHIVMLDNGTVIESGELTQVWQSHAMRPWQSFTEQSSLFEAQVVEHNPRYGLTQVLLGDNYTLWTQHYDAKPGSKLRVQIRASDVSLTLSQPTDSSIRNILKTFVVSIEHCQQAPDRQSVIVELGLGSNQMLSASITRWALDELELKQGMEVFAQIKGVSISQRDISHSHLPQ
jgi:molybdate transport system ATP-binding protein